MGPGNRSKVFWLRHEDANIIYNDRILKRIHNEDLQNRARAGDSDENEGPWKRDGWNEIGESFNEYRTLRDWQQGKHTDFYSKDNYTTNVGSLLNLIESKDHLFPERNSAMYGGLGTALTESLTTVVRRAATEAKTETNTAINLASDARNDSNTDILNAESASSSSLEIADKDAKEDLSSAFQKIRTSITTDADGADVVEDTMVSANSIVDFQVQAIFGRAETELTPDVKSMVEGAITNLTNNASGDIADIFSTALSAAQTAIDTDTTTAISDSVASFEKESTPTLMRSYNRFAGTAVDINSVHGSGFLIGMSNIERGFTADIEKFRSSLQLEIFTKVYGDYINAFNSAFDKYVTSYVQEKQQYLATYSSLIPEYLKVYLTNFTSRLQAYLAHITEFMQSQKTITNNSTAKANTYISAQLDTIKTYISNYIDSNIKMKLQALGDENAFITNTAMHLNTQDLDKIKIGHAKVEQGLQFAVATISANQTNSDRQFEIEQNRAYWEIDTLTRLGNLLTIGKGTGAALGKQGFLSRLQGDSA